MSEFRIRRRTRLKQKESAALRDRIRERLGEVELWADGASVEIGEAPTFDVVLVQNQAFALRVDGDPFLTVRGMLQWRPEKAYVTVDMGAVRFVHNGADIMAPGIVDADPDLVTGDLCWVRDERNKQPLAVGRCTMDGPQMVSADKGKAVKQVHHIGDRLWEWEP